VVRLVEWAEGDLWILERSNTPEMTAFLGGPESEPPGQMYVIVTDDGYHAGSIGYWEHEEDGDTVWETGWAILPEHQRKGLATAAIAEVVKAAAAEDPRKTLHAYPGVDNAASNALCSKAGFTLLGAREFEYPKGHWMTCNDWYLDL
jgi:RimJ/RimL family protein N-acetyltransferase